MRPAPVRCGPDPPAARRVRASGMSVQRIILASCVLSICGCATVEPAVVPIELVVEPQTLEPPVEYATSLEIYYDATRSNGHVEIDGAVARPGRYRINDNHGMPTLRELLRIAGELKQWRVPPAADVNWAVILHREYEGVPYRWVLRLERVRRGDNPIGLNDGDSITVVPVLDVDDVFIEADGS